MLLSILLVLLSTSVANAQSVILNPTKVQFTASADHSITVGGVPLVERYELRHYVIGSSTPVSVVNIGKPTPDATNTIVFTFAALPFSNTTQYFARVVAIGSTGEGVSANSSETYFFAGAPVPPATVSVKK
jgi:hypothetical protein